jgi:Txe/YoeB family toxin of Txe-Axe toxin-antitoxin module
MDVLYNSIAWNDCNATIWVPHPNGQKNSPKKKEKKESTNIKINQLVQFITKTTYSQINKRENKIKPNMLSKF